MKRWFIAAIGTKEMLLHEESQARARRVVERWIRLFWHRWVARTATIGLGIDSLAYEIDSDPKVVAMIVLCGEGSSPSVVGNARTVVDRFEVLQVRGMESTVEVVE